MKKVHLFTLLLLTLILIAACGGGEPAVETEEVETAVEETITEAEPTEEPVEEMEETEEAEVEAEEAEAEEMEESEEEMEEEAEAEEEMVEEEPTEEPMEEETAVGFGSISMSGTDPDTGLAINPETFGPGDTFIVRGTIISMNLTPVTSPEFLIESPAGTRYRIKSQPLADTFFIDGSQWEPFEYRQGVGAMATIMFGASLEPSDIPTVDDLVLVMQE